MSHWIELCGSNKQNPYLPKPKAEINRALWCPCAPCAVSALGVAVHSFQFSRIDEEFLSSRRLTWGTIHTALSPTKSPNGRFVGKVYSIFFVCVRWARPPFFLELLSEVDALLDDGERGRQRESKARFWSISCKHLHFDSSLLHSEGESLRWSGWSRCLYFNNKMPSIFLVKVSDMPFSMPGLYPGLCNL